MKINAVVCVCGSRWLHGNAGAERERLIRNPKTCVRGELSCHQIFKPACQLDSWESGPGVGGMFHTILAPLMLMHPRPSGFKSLVGPPRGQDLDVGLGVPVPHLHS